MGFELEILFVISCGCAGLLCGWLLFDSQSSSGAGLQLRLPKSKDNNTPSGETLAAVNEALRDMTQQVAADVDAHQLKIQVVSDSITQTDQAIDQDTILNAVAALANANQEMQGQLGRAREVIKEQENALHTAEFMAMTDSLTSVSNRRAFDLHIRRRILIDELQRNPTSDHLGIRALAGHRPVRLPGCRQDHAATARPAQSGRPAGRRHRQRHEFDQHRRGVGA